MCLIQCGGLWFVNGKVSITWNLKQAVVQKPKTSAIVEGVCFLKPKPADVQRLKSLPPPENDNIDPEGPVVSTIVEDSDDEYELPAPPTRVAQPVVEQVVEKVVEQAVEPVVTEEVPVAAATPVESKKKLLKKKGT